MKAKPTKEWREVTRERIRSVELLTRMQKFALGELISPDRAVETFLNAVAQIVAEHLEADGEVKLPPGPMSDAAALLREFLSRQTMTATQVNAATTLLKKCLPDLRQLENTGGGPTTNILVLPGHDENWRDALEQATPNHLGAPGGAANGAPALPRT